MDLPPNQAAALYLGAALRKQFPGITYLGSKADLQGFHVQFRDNEPFDQSLLSLLEKEMHNFSKEPIYVKEMLASNAAELFSQRQEDLLAEVLRGSNDLVHVASLAEYYDIYENEIFPTKHFTLLEFEQKGMDIKISGVAFSSQQELKNFNKRYQNYRQKNHSVIAKNLALYEQNFWHPNGINLLYALRDKWKKTLEKEGIYEIGPIDPKQYFSITGLSQFCFWQDEKDQIVTFSDRLPIFPLQIMQKWIKIFDFEAKWILPASSRKLAKAFEQCKISYVKKSPEAGNVQKAWLYIADGLGRYWMGPGLEWKGKMISFSLFGDLPRFAALLLEKTEGNFPFWLSPQQVRLLPIGEVRDEDAVKILDGLKVRYTVDRSQDLLKEKMHRALRAKIPYVMVFGKNEQNEGTVKIRACGSNREETMTLDQLKHFLVEQAIESQ